MSSSDDELDDLFDTGDGTASDAELITAVRAGDEQSFGVLWQRHEAAALRLARQLTSPSNAEDLVSESFARLLRALRQGGGPDGAFRPYLFSTLRRLNIDNARSYGQRVSLTAEDSDLETEPSPSAADVAAGYAENSAAWRAWASLPESSRTLLWHLVVEEETPAQIAPLIGTSANGVSSRAVRARERLRQAFLQQHVADALDEDCGWARGRLGEYVRNALSVRDRAAVQTHLDGCETCPAVLFEIADVNQTLRVVIAPIVLGGVTLAAYSGAGGLGAAAGSVGSARSGGAHQAASGAISRRVASTAVRGVLVATVGVLVAGGIAVAATMAISHSSRAGAVHPTPTATSPAALTTPVATASSRPATSSVPEVVAPSSSTLVVIAAPSTHVVVKPSPKPTPRPTPPPTSAVEVPVVPPPVASPTPTAPPTPTPPPSPEVVLTTITGQQHQGVWQTPDGTEGTVSVTAPTGWTITGVHPLTTSMTCTNTATTASCVVTGADIVANTAYQYTLDLTGPADDHTSTLTIAYGGAGDATPEVITPPANTNP